MNRSIHMTLCFILLPLCNVLGQTVKGNHELHVQVGDGLPPAIVHEISYALSDAFGSAFSGYEIEKVGNQLPGIFGAGYRYYVSARFSVGADVDYMKTTYDYTLTKGTEVRQGEREMQVLSGLITLQWVYLNKSKIQVYGELGGGISHFSGYSRVLSADKNTYNDTMIGVQLNPIGLRFGNRFGGYLSLGIGTRSIGTLGFSVRL